MHNKHCVPCEWDIFVVFVFIIAKKVCITTMYLYMCVMVMGLLVFQMNRLKLKKKITWNRIAFRTKTFLYPRCSHSQFFTVAHTHTNCIFLCCWFFRVFFVSTLISFCIYSHKVLKWRKRSGERTKKKLHCFSFVCF